ncbi:cAMP-binding domain of CRP or a regulatory subunit of cAMP-dependent protein kinases [Mucilaginibacter mallensis]|uniref:cAMP-binding domain of CRP or a regulatory subunit of cAMP-dependent protein kinases n=1 Tax=Mucilaginibacter mallensis TaxID=652787 RepID=A0A1H1UFU2_MUCMA|nr:response regulator [Mucilaginibacter mallensis]SDS71367.1 cAMP-binding domain of CRP or a regulatory subunit of cAMP-dependent protein kinases [Mucilaginibacter mallensis]
MSKKVLIIEDNDDIRENVIEILELAGYTVTSASNGKVGVELAFKEIPDIILCDIMMPEMDGYGVLYMLSKRPETIAIPFIFLTAKAEHFDRRKGMEMGADDYLTKPFDDMELLNAIESRLRKKEGQQAFYSKSLDRLNSLVAKRDGLAALQQIIAERKARSFKKSQVIYYEGDRGNGLYLLISGKVKTIKLAEDGRELMTGIYSADDYLGINAMLSNEEYTDTATALEDSLLCLIPKEQLEQLLNLYPEVAREFIKLLANDIREKEEQLLQMAYHSVRKKMAQALLRLHRQPGSETDSFKIAREDLAAMAAMATETVSRTLSDFKEEGLIEKTGSTITIIDLARLTKMKN